MARKRKNQGACGIEILEVGYYDIDSENRQNFTLFIKIKVNDYDKGKLDLLQGIISLKGIYKGHVFMNINSSILFINSGEDMSENIYYCYCDDLPLALHNYITINAQYSVIEILNYYLNVQLIGSFEENVPSVVLDKNYKLNLSHKNFTDSLELIDTKEYTFKEFECFQEMKYITESNEEDKIVCAEDLKNNFIAIVETGKIPERFNSKISQSNEPPVGQQLYQVKTTKQTISIRLNHPMYNLSAQSLIISITSTKQDLISGVSVQLYKKTRYSNAKISQKLDKFCLFAENFQQSILMNLPISIEDPTVHNEIEYKLLVKFVEPDLENEGSEELNPRSFFFNTSKTMQHGTKSVLSAEITGTLGVFYIPVLFKR